MMIQTYTTDVHQTFQHDQLIIHPTFCIISVRPKGFFSFRPKPKIAETAIFLFGRNRYRNRKKVSLSAETDTETETTVLKKSAII